MQILYAQLEGVRYKFVNKDDPFDGCTYVYNENGKVVAFWQPGYPGELTEAIAIECLQNYLRFEQERSED